MKRLLTLLLLTAFAVGCASTDMKGSSSDGMMNDKSMKHDDMKMQDGMKGSMDKDHMM